MTKEIKLTRISTGHYHYADSVGNSWHIRQRAGREQPWTLHKGDTLKSTRATLADCREQLEWIEIDIEHDRRALKQRPNEERHEYATRLFDTAHNPLFDWVRQDVAKHLLAQITDVFWVANDGQGDYWVTNLPFFTGDWRVGVEGAFRNETVAQAYADHLATEWVAEHGFNPPVATYRSRAYLNIEIGIGNDPDPMWRTITVGVNGQYGKWSAGLYLPGARLGNPDEFQAAFDKARELYERLDRFCQIMNERIARRLEKLCIACEGKGYIGARAGENPFDKNECPDCGGTGYYAANADSAEPQDDWPFDTPQSVVEALEAVRNNGAYNMFDRPNVTALAEQMGYTDAVDWLAADRSRYSQALNDLGAWLQQQ